MNERELLVDCLRRLHRLKVNYCQLGDAAGVIAVQGDALDKDYMRKWAEDLDVLNTLERLLGGEIKPKRT
jgi:hypothetical protein